MIHHIRKPRLKHPEGIPLFKKIARYASLYWAELFSASGHDQLRHNDVIKFSQYIFTMFRQFENFDIRNFHTLELQNNMNTKLRRLFGEV